MKKYVNIVSKKQDKRYQKALKCAFNMMLFYEIVVNKKNLTFVSALRSPFLSIFIHVSDFIFVVVFKFLHLYVANLITTAVILH